MPWDMRGHAKKGVRLDAPPGVNEQSETAPNLLWRIGKNGEIMALWVHCRIWPITEARAHYSPAYGQFLIYGDNIVFFDTGI